MQGPFKDPAAGVTVFAPINDAFVRRAFLQPFFSCTNVSCLLNSYPEVTRHHLIMLSSLCRSPDASVRRAFLRPFFSCTNMPCLLNSYPKVTRDHITITSSSYVISTSRPGPGLLVPGAFLRPFSSCTKVSCLLSSYPEVTHCYVIIVSCFTEAVQT